MLPSHQYENETLNITHSDSKPVVHQTKKSKTDAITFIEKGISSSRCKLQNSLQH